MAAGPGTALNDQCRFSVWAQFSTEMQRKIIFKKKSNNPSIATNGFMVQAYQVPDANKVQSHVALLQCSLWHPSRPTPGVLNSRKRLRAAVICGRTALGCGHTNTRERWSGSRPRAGTFSTNMFVAYTLIMTMAGAYRPGNCVAAR